MEGRCPPSTVHCPLKKAGDSKRESAAEKPETRQSRRRRFDTSKGSDVTISCENDMNESYT